MFWTIVMEILILWGCYAAYMAVLVHRRGPVGGGGRIVLADQQLDVSEEVNRMKKHPKAALLCGILGCLCCGGGDWLMMAGNPAYHGTLSWLTEGVAAIPQWRFNLAMALAFPGIILYGIALFAVETYIREEKHRKVYHWLNAFRLGFTNGLMSESMILWFGIMLIWERRRAAL